ncbi:MAG: sugar phosphorylase [Pirellulaceae bacterium]
MSKPEKTDGELKGLLRSIYGTVPDQLLNDLQRRIDAAQETPQRPSSLWSQSDVVLICYADQIRDRDCSPLTSLRQFLVDYQLQGLLKCIHLLPFCPYSSDDGFSVIDYLAVDPNAGDWGDIEALGRSFDLMFDLVLNHCSRHNEWFQRFLQDDAEFADYFVTADPSCDLSQVTRPRSLPLLTPFATPSGVKHVWTTFSDDQVDLNYANPMVLLRMLDVLIEYARRGARIVRLDAIAFLWKQIGTSCIHLPQTHAIVQLMRFMLDRIAPGTLLLTETNVPHAENVAYFGDGNEAHMVYQFSLPPLLLEAVCSGDTSLLVQWLKTIRPTYPQTTYFNFTASHDGIGVRPLEGLVPQERIDRLVLTMQRRGGRVGMRRRADGVDVPYELNISYVDAVADVDELSPQEHAERFLATQAIMLSLQGIPAVYFHSLVGSSNDLDAVAATGINRRINRHKYQRDVLDRTLQAESSRQRLIFDGYIKLLQVRTSQPAFHPDAAQEILDLPTDGLLGMRRTARSGECIVVVANLTTRVRNASIEFSNSNSATDLLSSEMIDLTEPIPLSPFQVRWLLVNAN